MSAKYRDKNCLVYDNGLFVELALKLAEDFNKVYYYSPWESGFPTSNVVLIGKGLPGLVRTNDLWSVLDKVDLFVFPDIYSGGLQKYLDSIGKKVWGSRNGDSLELYREAAKDLLSEANIPIGPYEVVTGLEDLRKYLKEHDNQWVKISMTRGDMETFNSPNYKLIEPRLDELEHSLGAKKYIIEFIVEESIEPAVEIGFDGYCIDGQFPSASMWGIEVKEKGYVGKFVKVEEMPKQVKYVNEKIAPIMKKFKYRNFFSTELRVKDKVPYFIDPCCRAGSPPNEVYQEMYTNLSEIIWEGAGGKLVDPEPAGKYGVELILQSTWADKNWQSIQFPKELRNNVKLWNLTRINKEYYVVPRKVDFAAVGAVIAIEDTAEKAIEKCKEYAKEVKGYYLDVFPDSLDQGMEEIGQIEKELKFKF